MVFDHAFENIKAISVIRYFLSFNDQEVKARVYRQQLEKIKKRKGNQGTVEKLVVEETGSSGLSEMVIKMNLGRKRRVKVG